MLKSDVDQILAREPFSPLRIHLKDGRFFDIPFRDVARTLSYGVLVFIGLKEGTRQAKSYDRFPFFHIDRIEEHRGRTSGRRKKAS